MLRNKEQRILLILGSLAIVPLAHSAETIFFEDFGCTGASGTKTGGGICDGGATTAPTPGVTWVSETPTDGQGGGMFRKGSTSDVNHVIRADDMTSAVTQDAAPLNFSVTGRNWDIHDGSQNTNVSGYRTPNLATNPNMQGNMLGHVKTGSSLPNDGEDNYYQINNIALNANMSDIELSFDFDASIFYDGDGFGVAFSTNGTDFDILNPTSGMNYVSLNTADTSLNKLLGEFEADGVTPKSTVKGYRANMGTWSDVDHGYNQAGTALFDLSGLGGQTISLRFAWASVDGNTGSGDGINIDNIKVTGICTTGSGPNCNTPGNNAPEPASLGLALLGLTAAWRRRAKRA